MTRVAIIGGGAAGMFCAANLSPELETTVFESGESALRKVCASGGGRCNFTNENIDTGNPADFYPRGGGSLKKPLKRFGAADARKFFGSLGIESKVEDGGRVFPVCDNARAIAGALYRRAARNGAKIEFSARVSAIEKTADGRFALKYTGADKEPFDAVVVAVGGTFGGGLKESVEKFGIKTVPPVASLFSLETDTAKDPAWRGLSGISLDAEAQDSIARVAADCKIRNRRARNAQIFLVRSAGFRREKLQVRVPRKLRARFQRSRSPQNDSRRPRKIRKKKSRQRAAFRNTAETLGVLGGKIGRGRNRFRKHAKKRRTHARRKRVGIENFGDGKVGAQRGIRNVRRRGQNRNRLLFDDVEKSRRAFLLRRMPRHRRNHGRIQLAGGVD